MVARRLQRPPHHRPDLRRQPAPDHDHSVVVDEGADLPPFVPPPLVVRLRLPVHPAPRPRQALHVRRRGAEREVEQSPLVVRRRHPRQRAHLGIGDPPAPHRVAQQRQPAERARHPHLLAGRPERQPGAPVQPVRARHETAPAALLVEGEDQHQQLVGRGLDARGELRDVVAETLAVGPALHHRRAGVGARRSGGRRECRRREHRCRDRRHRDRQRRIARYRGGIGRGGTRCLEVRCQVHGSIVTPCFATA